MTIIKFVIHLSPHMQYLPEFHVRWAALEPEKLTCHTSTYGSMWPGARPERKHGLNARNSQYLHSLVP